MSSAVSLGEIRRRLQLEDASATLPSELLSRDAAVAMILSGAGEDLELCFIRRAERAGDRWSGHLAFPGGRPGLADASLRATAERETLEEVGLDLRDHESLGGLPPVQILRGPRDLIGNLYAFVYYAGTTKPPLTLEPSEVDSAFWAPLTWLHDETRRTDLAWENLTFPAVRMDGGRLWGLTLRVCEVWSQIVGRPMRLQWPMH